MISPSDRRVSAVGVTYSNTDIFNIDLFLWLIDSIDFVYNWTRLLSAVITYILLYFSNIVSFLVFASNWLFLAVLKNFNTRNVVVIISVVVAYRASRKFCE